jgi:excisionase family DNA binding protein
MAAGVNPKAMEKLLKALEVCRILGVSLPTLYSLVKTGQLKGYFVARKWKFAEPDILRYLERVAVSA